MTILTFKGAAASMLLGLAAVCLAATVKGQESPVPPPSQQQNTISDQELRSFAKAYVKTQKLREEYQASAKDVRDPKESEKLQLEAAVELKKALQEEGLSVESYNRIFAMVNTDKELRNRTLKFIEEERERS